MKKIGYGYWAKFWIHRKVSRSPLSSKPQIAIMKKHEFGCYDVSTSEMAPVNIPGGAYP